MTTMQAITMAKTGGPEVFCLSEVPMPAAVGSEFLIKVMAAGVNPIDAKTRAGNAVSDQIRCFPAVLGQDFSGVVVESPYESHPIKPGDEVYGMVVVPRSSGSYAQYVAVSSLSVAKKPRGISHLEAAAVPVAALTAWGLIVDVAKAHEGQRILIHAGAGGVGHFAVQFARYFGAYVIATGSQRNLGWLRELGAHEVIDYASTPFDTALSGVDVVIDLVGNVQGDTGTRSLGVLRRGGLIVNVPSGSWPTFLADAAEAGVRASTFTVAPDGSALAVISRLITSGDITIHVDEVFDLPDAAAAHRSIESGHTRGKIVLKVADF